MDPLLVQLGIGVASNAIYDFVQLKIASKTLTEKELANELTAFLHIEGQIIKAERIISFLAQNGDILIKKTSIKSNDSIVLASSNKTTLTLGDNSVSQTPSTSIEAGDGARIIIQGGAQVRQDDKDGSIRFIS